MKRNKLLNLLSIVAVMALLPGCGLLGGGEPGAEVEIVFWAEPDVVPRGGCAMLHWEAHSAEEYRVLLNGEEVPPFGEEEVCLHEPTVFELLVEAPEGPIEQILTIEIEGEGPPEEPPPGEIPPEEPPPEEPPPEREPEVITLELHPDMIPQGGCATLFWEVHPPGEWPVLLGGEEVEPVGERQVCPEATTTYQLLVEGPGGPQQRTVTLRIEGEPEPPPPLTPPPGATPPPQPTQPGPQPTQPGLQPTTPAAPSGADVRPSDLYPDSQPQGNIWVRVVNNGPATLTNKKVRISGSYTRSTKTTPPSASGANIPAADYTINLAPGEQQNINLGYQIDLNQYNYDFTVTVQAVDFTDPNTGNNTYTESFHWAAPTPTQPTAQGDLILQDVSLSADGQALVFRVATSPIGWWTGPCEYEIVATVTSVVLFTGEFTIAPDSGSLTFGAGPTPTGATLRITIDPNGKIPETNENNNTITKTF
jgi:hypothetical protein